jgi:hypothetical protein
MASLKKPSIDVKVAKNEKLYGSPQAVSKQQLKGNMFMRQSSTLIKPKIQNDSISKP